MTEQLLAEAELADDNDLDAQTIDDVVARVRASYEAKMAETLAELETRSHAAVDQSRASEDAAALRAQQLQRAIEGRARLLALWLVRGPYWLLTILAAVGATAVLLAHPIHPGTWFVLLPVGVFVALEVFGVLRHLAGLRARAEQALARRLQRWLSGPHT
jgi:hypothetical protein